MRILLVEDDTLLGDAIQVGLRRDGFAVDWVHDGGAAVHALVSEEFAAVVLDIGLPRVSGMEVLTRTRAAGNRTPILILTAHDEVEQRIAGLDGGADDYVIKPIDLHELAARLRALVRRSHGAASAVLRVGSIELDTAARVCRHDGTTVALQAREFDLLMHFMLNAGRVLTREVLEAKLYGWGEEVESNALEVHVHHLRRKLGQAAIRTVRGVGYLLQRETEVG